MSDISLDINIKIKKALDGGDNVHAWAFCVGDAEQRGIALKVARALLPFGWIGDDNPDLFLVGTQDAPAKIQECREFMNDVALLPVSSAWRIGVIFAADKLLLPAANSLLKITEEPPAHVKLVFLMQTSSLLPTLRSRVRFIPLSVQVERENSPLPQSDSEWLAWLAKMEDVPDVTTSLGGWGSYAVKNGDAELAFKIENIRLFLDGGKLPKAMACDLVLLALKERLDVENLFGNFW